MNQQKPPPVDQKNLILALVLSMGIIFLWQLFYVAPKQEAQQAALKQQQAQQQVQAAQQAEQGSVAGTATQPVAIANRADVVKASQRLKIETPDVVGSINLEGAKFDDLQLVNYKETVKAGSPMITLLSPIGVKDAYVVEQGFQAAAGTTLKVPDEKTKWTAPANAVLALDKPVTLTWDNGEGVIFRRDISISDKFVFTVKQIVENKTQAAVAVVPFARVQRHDTPLVAGWYVFFEGLLGVQNGKLTEAGYADVAEPGGALEIESKGGWLGFTDKYWATALIPDTNTESKASYQHFKIGGTRDAYLTGYLAKTPLAVPAGASINYEDHFFAGAKQVSLIEEIGEKYKLDRFDLMIDWGWFSFLTKPMFYLLQLVQGIVGNFGLAILVVTVLVKLALFQLANKSFASMSKMKKLQPEMERIKAAYPDDKMKQQQEVMEMYKKEKVSPLSGCLPIFIQIPVFFALYKVILTSIELRHAPFYGWISDLSAQDPTHLFNLFGLIPWDPPGFLAIGVWPILMGITMWIQMRLNPAPADPIQASLFNWMPIIFTFMLATFPAGLVIYWTWSNLLTILQQSYIMKKNGVDVDILGNIRESIPFLRKNVPVVATAPAAASDKKKG